MTAKDIKDRYIQFFKNRNHVEIENSSLVPLNDPTTLFTSSGMQPLLPYLLGEKHPAGKRLVNAQNCFRAQDIDEIGDNRHTTFFRMLGNWSLGDSSSPDDTGQGGYFKTDQLKWIFDFLIDPKEGLGLDPGRLFVTVFEGYKNIPKDTESINIWKTLFQSAGIDAIEGERIFAYDARKNWWSRAGVPENMPVGEPGGPDSEVFYDFGEDLRIHENSEFKNEKCHPNCDCGRYIEIANSVFMQYIKSSFAKASEGQGHEFRFEELPQKNVDFGGGLERLVAVSENKEDVFKTSLFYPIIESIENTTAKEYLENKSQMRIIADHFLAAIFIISNSIVPSNKEQGYILRRLIRRGLDNFYLLNGDTIVPIIEKIVDQYKDTDPDLINKFEIIKNTILEEEQAYQRALSGGKKMIEKELIKGGIRIGDELMGPVEITAEMAFKAITSFGLGPTQLESLGYAFDKKELAEKIKQHQSLSREGAEKKFAGGLSDHNDLTVKGHTATHLMHQALRDVLGEKVHQSGSNITSERVRFDFNYDEKLTDEQLKEVESIVRQKITDDLPVFSTVMSLDKAKDLGAIGLFNEKYGDKVKIYTIGGTESDLKASYSKEFCGGPHVEKTSQIKSFDILKEEGISSGIRRIYAKVT